jgi:hypothetical protein
MVPLLEKVMAQCWVQGWEKAMAPELGLELELTSGQASVLDSAQVSVLESGSRLELELEH